MPKLLVLFNRELPHLQKECLLSRQSLAAAESAIAGLQKKRKNVAVKVSNLEWENV